MKGRLLWNASHTRGRSRYLLLILYFVVTSILIIALVSTPLYIYTVGALEHERSVSNDLLLKQVRNDVDSILTQVGAGAAKILTGRTVSDIVFNGNHDLYATSYDKVKDIWDVQSLLNNEMNYYPFINSIYIYFENTGTVLTSSFYLPVDEFYDWDMIKKLGATEQSGWLEARNMNRDELGVKYTAAPARVISYYQWAGYGYGKGKVAVVINVNTQAITNTADTVGLQMYLANKRGDILVSYGEARGGNLLKLGLDAEKFAGQTDYWVQDVDGSKYLISSSPSMVNDWTYIILMPYAEVMQPLTKFKETIVFVLVACALLALLLALLLSKNFYKPIQQLTDQVAQWAGHPFLSRDDFANLNSAFSTLMTESRTFNDMMKENRKVIMEKYVLDMLTYSTSISPPTGTAFSCRKFCVMCLKMENPPSDEMQATSRLLLLSAVEMVCMNTCKELGSELFCTRLDDRTLALVINTNEDEATNKYSAAFRDVISTSMSQVCTIGVSRMHGQQQLPVALSEAKRALSYSMLYSAGSIVHIEDVADSSTNNNEEAISLQEEDLMVAVGHRDIDRALAIADKIGEIMKGIPPEQFHRAKFIILHACQKLTDLVSPISEFRYQGNADLFSQYRDTEKATHLQELTAVLKGALKTTISQLDDRAKQMDTGMIARVLDYINAHFNEDFGLIQLADRVGIHPAYLGRLLKKATGNSFNQILTDVRIEKALLFLQTTDMNINDIYAKVGYNNRQSFLRSFKGQTGMTPSEYRTHLASERLNGQTKGS